MMTALVCLSAATAVWSFDIFLMQTIKETIIENKADKYFAEVAEYAAENSEAIAEYAKRELELRKEKNVQCHDKVFFDESNGVLNFFDYGVVSYCEPIEEYRVWFSITKNCCNYTVTYTEMPLNYFNDIYEEKAADNIYLNHTMNRHEMMQEIYG